jgi:hypothetical protein
MATDESKIRAVLGGWIQPEGALIHYGSNPRTVYYPSVQGKVTLEGCFTAEQLEAVAAWMRIRTATKGKGKK